LYASDSLKSETKSQASIGKSMKVVVLCASDKNSFLFLDRFLKVSFMFFVGMLMPKIAFTEGSVLSLIVDVLAITFLCNIGKCFPIFCHKKETSLRQRIALGIAMCPRGEVGAGILLLAISKGAGGYATTVSAMSLALNILLTGLIVYIAIKLVKKDPIQPIES
jgi:Kef-type K+ transport system membrane component KefB